MEIDVRKTLNLAAAVRAAAEHIPAALTLAELVRAYAVAKLDCADLRLRKWTDSFGHESAWDIRSDMVETAALAMVTGIAAWAEFVKRHPELGYLPGRWGFQNFLRHYRGALVDRDAIRLAKRRFKVAHVERFVQTSFDCATGREAAVTHAAQRIDGLSGTKALAVMV